MNIRHQSQPIGLTEVMIINGFVLDGAGGNPAGVVLDADSLSEEDMQRIARDVGLSETAFVSGSDVAGFKFDFFTPNRRIAHCGHATIAAFSYMASQGIVADGKTSKETVDGVREIVIRDGAAYMEQLAPVYTDASDWSDAGVAEADVLASLRLAPGGLDRQDAPVVVNTGNGFMLVGVRDRDALAAIEPDLKRIDEISEKLDLVGYYVYTTDTGSADRDATTRMFAPRYAIDEEAATGMAAGPLACLMFDRLGVRKPALQIEQGMFMSPPSPSLLDVQLQFADGRIDRLSVGGFGKVMDRRAV